MSPSTVDKLVHRLLENIPRLADATGRGGSSPVPNAGPQQPDEVRDYGVNAFDVAQHLRCQVVLDRQAHGRGRIKQMSGRTVIFLKPELRRERLQWALAHELGEFLAPELAGAGDLEDHSREDLANAFAVCLLLPMEPFRNLATRTGGDLLALKAAFPNASHELIASRLLSVGLDRRMLVFDHGRLTRLRTSRGAARQSTTGDPLWPIERDCWQAVRLSGQPARREQATVATAAWPIYEANWQREILLTTLPIDDDQRPASDDG